MIGSTVNRSDDQREVGSKIYYYVRGIWMSCKLYEERQTRHDEVDILPFILDLGRRLDSSKRETCCPHVSFVKNDAIIDVPKEAIAGTIRSRMHDTSLTCETFYPIPYRQLN